jgi:hypothetical protein
MKKKKTFIKAFLKQKQLSTIEQSLPESNEILKNKK